MQPHLARLKIRGAGQSGDNAIAIAELEVYAAPVPTYDFTVSNFRSGGEFDNEAWAAFAQATYDLTDRLQLTVGGRYTDEQKSFTPDQIIFQNYYAGISAVVPPGNPLAALDAPFLQAGERILPLLKKKIDIDEFTQLEVGGALDTPVTCKRALVTGRLACTVPDRQLARVDARACRRAVPVDWDRGG